MKLPNAPFWSFSLRGYVTSTNEWEHAFVQQQITTVAPTRRNYQKRRVGPIVTIRLPFFSAIECTGRTCQLAQQILAYPFSTIFILQSQNPLLLIYPKYTSFVKDIRQDQCRVVVWSNRKIPTGGLMFDPSVVRKVRFSLPP